MPCGFFFAPLKPNSERRVAHVEISMTSMSNGAKQMQANGSEPATGKEGRKSL